MGRRTLAAAVVAVAVLLQVVVVDRLPLPGGVTPDLVLLAVVALALVNGSLPGLVTGFCAGLVTDLVPAAHHTIGRYAFVYCLVGYLAGLARGRLGQSAMLPFVAMALGAFGGSAIYAALGALLGDPGVTWSAVCHVLPLSVFYDALVSPFLLYVVVRLTGRIEAEDSESALIGAPLPVDRYRSR